MKNLKVSSAWPKAFVLIFALLTACSNAPDSGSSSSGSTGGGGSNNTVSDGSPLYLTLYSKWENTSTYVPVDTCEIPSTAVAPSVLNCDMSIPEAEMYFSDIRFEVGTTRTDVCGVVHFLPYYYQKSNSATFLPPHQTSTIDCSGATNAPAADCYGGAAPVIMGSDFPNYTGKFFVTSFKTSSTFDVASESSLQKYWGSVNYLLTNDLINQAGSSSLGDDKDHVGGTFQNYEVVCSDQWGTIKHVINLTLHDEDGDGSDPDNTQDEYPDWQ